MRRFSYLHVDVFTARPFGGNPLSVFLDARTLGPEEMQAIAREMNHSESTFLFPAESGGAARVRIFTPATELPFAGHPVIGTTFVIASERNPGQTGKMEQTLELAGGTVATSIERNGGPDFCWMTQKVPEKGTTVADVDRLARALGIGRGDIAFADAPAEVWSTGYPFLFVPLSGLTDMGRARPNPQVLHDLCHEAGARGVYLACRETTTQGATVRGRCFPVGVGVAEDAATGSAAGALAGWLLAHRWASPGRTVIEQGIELGRESRIHVDARPGEAVRVGGQVVAVGRGELAID